MDVTSIDEAVELAGPRCAPAWIGWEAGTPLILAEGVTRRGVAGNFPSTPSWPISRPWTARVEAEMMFKAGANMVVVMGQAHDASIIEQVKMAKQYGGQVMCDVMLCPDKPGRAKEAQDLGVDYIIVHTGFDERNMIPGLSPLDDLQSVLDAGTFPYRPWAVCPLSRRCRRWRWARPARSSARRWSSATTRSPPRAMISRACCARLCGRCEAVAGRGVGAHRRAAYNASIHLVNCGVNTTVGIPHPYDGQDLWVRSRRD
ncbi:MAG: hypothetical protein R2838_16610 [Caldilineaceae bacterium]